MSVQTPLSTRCGDVSRRQAPIARCGATFPACAPLQEVASSPAAADSPCVPTRFSLTPLTSSDGWHRPNCLRLQPPAELLRSALGLWRGCAFGELADLAAVCAQARALEQLRIGARAQLADALLKSAEFPAAIAAAEALLAELPLDEHAWELLIRSLSGAGRTAEALQAYRRAYDALAAVGLEPTEKLRQAQTDAFDAPAPVSVTPALDLSRRSPAGP